MINNEIKSDVVEIVATDGSGLTRMTLSDAIKLAEETDEDVVEVSNKDGIPVCKIISYSKFLYDKKRKEKENAKKSRLNSQDTKEIIISTSISEHDLQTKAKNVDRILKDNNKVKLTIRYKGREVRLINQGIDKLNIFENLVTVKHKIDKPAKIEGKQVSMIVAP